LLPRQKLCLRSCRSLASYLTRHHAAYLLPCLYTLPARAPFWAASMSPLLPAMEHGCRCVARSATTSFTLPTATTSSWKVRVLPCCCSCFASHGTKRAPLIGWVAHLFYPDCLLTGAPLYPTRSYLVLYSLPDCFHCQPLIIFHPTSTPFSQFNSSLFSIFTRPVTLTLLTSLLCDRVVRGIACMLDVPRLRVRRTLQPVARAQGRVRCARAAHPASPSGHTAALMHTHA